MRVYRTFNPFVDWIKFIAALVLFCALIAAPRPAKAVASSSLLNPGSFTSLGANPFTTAGVYSIDTSVSNSTPILTLPDSTTIHGVFSSGVAVFTFDNIVIPTNVTVVGVQDSGSRPVALLSRSNVTVAGVVDVSGAAGADDSGTNVMEAGSDGGAAGPGGGGGGGGGGSAFAPIGVPGPTVISPPGSSLSSIAGAGGSGGVGFVNGDNGGNASTGDESSGGNGGNGGAVVSGGAGSGGLGLDNAGGGGAFGGNGGAGAGHGTTAAGGTAYGDIAAQLQGGSGGGGGGGVSVQSPDPLPGSAGGGGGGGAVEIGAVGQLVISGSVLANGGDSGAGNTTIGGGGGAGGGILIQANLITLWGSSTLSAAGGAGGPLGNVGTGGGGGGRIGIFADTTIVVEGSDVTTHVDLAAGSGGRGGPSGSNGVLVTSGTICPTVRVVINDNDSGPGSLRQAILDGNDCAVSNTILFAPSAYGTITLTSGELVVSSDLNIYGPGATNVTVNGNYPNVTNRVFAIDGSLTVTIAGLTVSNGFDNSNLTPEGGGIFNPQGNLTVSNCTVVGNMIGSSAPESDGGGIYDQGTLTLVNSLVIGNSFTGHGFGGGIYVDVSGNLTVLNSTICSNVAGSSGSGGGIHNNGGTVEILNSSVVGNHADFDGGGIGNDSGGSATVLNSTINGNSAELGGGIYNADAFSGTTSTLTIGSTILENTASIGDPNIETVGNGGTAITISLGYNMATDNGSGALTNSTDLTNTNAMLGPLADNGGPTYTCALLCGSPAIDAGTNFSGSATDQRGLPRTVVTSGIVNGSDGTDIGAVEAQQQVCSPPVAICTNVTVSAGTNCTASASIDGGSYDPNPGGKVTLAQSPPGPYGLGTNAVTLIVTDNYGGSNSCSGTVIVVDTTPPTIICPSDITSNTAPGECGAIVAWKGPEAVDNCGTVNVWCSPSSGTLFAQGTTKVMCTATDGSGNSTNCSFNVTVNQSAVCGITVSGSANGLTICQGSSVILTAANGMKSYLWSGPEQNGATVRTIVVSTAGTYYCTQQQYYGSTNCCSVTVVVNPPPNATITGNLIITNGLPTTLVGPSGLASQYWTGPQNNGLGSQSNTVIDPGTYTLHVTDSNGCQNTGSVTVLNQTPAPCSITVSGDAGDLTICRGLTSILTGANGMSSYLWSGPEQSGATAKSIRVGTQGTYTVQQIDGAGLTNSCSVFLTVHPSPSINIFGIRTICQGSNTTLSGPSGMSQYLWLGPQNNGLEAQSNTVSVAGTYTLQITDSNGCQNALAVPVTAIVCP